jgi:hypothetical protein
MGEVYLDAPAQATVIGEVDFSHPARAQFV